MIIPEKIRALLGDRVGTENSVGMSGSSVTIYDDCVLKAEKRTPETDSAMDMLRWLQGKLPVPKILAQENANEISWLLMSKADGVMSCDSHYLKRPFELMALLAEGLKALWAADTAGCPKIRSLDDMLREAAFRAENGLVDMDNTEPDTFGPNGFRDPGALLDWLIANKPEEDWALTHGDYCLPNLFLKDGKVSCFIDLGDTALSDRWRDIALCWRSMNSNFAGAYGGPVYENPDPERLFRELGIRPDWDRIRWHILLDELF